MSEGPSLPQYPQYPATPQAPGGAPYTGGPQYPGTPGGEGWQPQERPPKPAPVARAVQLMYVGAALSLIELVVGLASHGSFRAAVIKGNPGLTPHQVTTATNVAVALVVVLGLIGIGLWLWMAWAVGRGRNWARVTGTVFFGFATLGIAGDASKNVPTLSLVFAALVWLTGLVTVVLLWRSESSRYFKPLPQSR